MGVLRSIRKLVLGETWILPGGIALAVGAAALLRVASGPGGWWESAGGFVLAGLLAVALAVAVLRR